MATNGSEQLTIDELARRTGMTVRNIRAHQSRGLLPAPEVRGRTGFYGPEHETRIELIRELQADGFKLEAISRLLESAGGSNEEVLRFTRAVKAPFEDETPQIVTAEELAERFSDAGKKAGDMLRRAEKLGLLRPLPDGNFEELSPRLGRASAELRALGIPTESALYVARELRKHSDQISKTMVELFIREIWKPFEEAGAARSGPPEGPRGARAPAPARLRRAPGDVPACDDRGGRAADGSGARAARAAGLGGNQFEGCATQR